MHLRVMWWPVGRPRRCFGWSRANLEREKEREKEEGFFEFRVFSFPLSHSLRSPTLFSSVLSLFPLLFSSKNEFNKSARARVCSFSKKRRRSERERENKVKARGRERGSERAKKQQSGFDGSIDASRFQFKKKEKNFFSSSPHLNSRVLCVSSLRSARHSGFHCVASRKGLEAFERALRSANRRATSTAATATATSIDGIWFFLFFSFFLSLL